MKVFCLIALCLVAIVAWANYDFVTGVGKAQYSNGILPIVYAVSGLACLGFGIFQLFKDSKIIGIFITLISAMLFVDFFKISLVIIKAASQTAGQDPSTVMLVPLAFIALLIFSIIPLRVIRMWRSSKADARPN